MTDCTRSKFKEIAAKTAIKLPPDVLMHPMPFPDRLDYAEKLILEALMEAYGALTTKDV